MLLSSLKKNLLILLLFLIGSSTFAQKQVENIDRGMVAIRVSSQEEFMVHEEPANYGIPAVEMRNAATGAIVTSNQVSAPPSNTIIFQENETGFCGVEGSIDDNHTGFTGTGFSNSDNELDKGIDYQLNIEEEGNYIIGIRYANATTTSRAMKVLLNDTEVGILESPNTGAWTTWSISELEVFIEKGEYLLRLAATTSAGLPNLDYMSITGLAATPLSCDTDLGTNTVTQIYVAPNGDDTNPGTITQPLASIQQAQALASPGDTVFIRGGLYQVREDQIARIQQNLFACISFLDKSGLPGQTIKYWAYPSETPVFDFSNVSPADRRVVGIWVDQGTEYIHIKGLEMTGIQVNILTHTESYCIYSRGSNNIFEQLSMHDNVGTALRHFRGGNNLFLNCDAYRNHDNVSEEGIGDNNDGFGCHPDAGGAGNIFRGCRAWFNSDDGFDIIRADESVVFENCWAFYNGFSPSFESLGDGNGFKAGGYAFDSADRIPNPVPRNTVRFCIAVRNKASGFYSNHHLAGNDWYNNSAYFNRFNFNMVNRESPQVDNIWVDGYDHVLKNNLSYKPFGLGKHTEYIDTAQNIVENNSFDLPITLTDDDFISLDQALLSAPRKPDGSLPDIDFMRPVQGSALRDAGVDIGFPFLGDAPDLGAIETDNTTTIETIEQKVTEKIALFQNAPNPFNSQTNISYTLLESGYIDLSVYNTLGQKICTLVGQNQRSGVYSAGGMVY